MKRIIFTLSFICLLSTGSLFAQGTETFTNLSSATGGSSGSYVTRTWTGDDGSTWTATKARTDQTINGAAIFLNDDNADTYVESGSISGGVGDLTLTTQRFFSGGSGTLNVLINGSNVGTVPYSDVAQTTTISGIDVSGTVIIRVNNDIGGSNGGGADRVAIDDMTWTGFAATTPTVGFDAPTGSETETAATFSVDIPVSMVSHDGNQVDLSVAVTGGTAEMGDYTLNTSALSFTADGTQNISIDINDDMDSDDETVEITIAETTTTGVTIGISVHTLTIIDDDLPMLVINEIQADPDATNGDANGDGTVSTTQDEFVEIVNNDIVDIDISGYTLSDALNVKHTFPAGTIVGVGESIVVFGGGTPTGIPGLSQVASGGLGLNNGGDDVTIKNPGGTVIVTETYGSAGGDNQSIGRDPDLTGAFVKHSTITTNPVLFSPGAHNVDGTPFTVVNPQIFTGATDVCVNVDLAVSTGSGMWQDIMSGGEIIASFNDNGENLGLISTDVYLHSGAVRTNADGIEYLDRSIYITPANQPNAPVDVRIYFTDAELTAFLAADADASSIADLVLSKTSGISCSGAFVEGTTELITPTSMAYENGHYLEFSVNGFSGFFPQSGSIPLPVELTSFRATLLENNSVSLDWTTASELNNAYFEVQKSSDGERFSPLGIVEGAGTTTETQNYQFVDNAPALMNYYRIMQVDHDGTVSYSNTEVVQISKTGISYSIFPNPVKGSLNINLGGSLETVTLDIIDMTGKVVSSEIRTAEGVQNINTEYLVPGVYFLNVMTNNDQSTIRFVKR